MRLLDWKKEFSVGVSALDREHRDLIDTINLLHDEFDDPDHPRDAASLLLAVIEVVAAHFAEEEAAMQLGDYSGFAAHKEDHDLLLEQLHDLAVAFEGADEVDSVDLALRLEPWFVRHFHSHDARMMEALRRH